MATAVSQRARAQTRSDHVRLDHPIHPLGTLAFLAVLLGGLMFTGWSIVNDTAQAGEPLAVGALLFLGAALLIALGFEFVNGFHDTANAVATVIYTHSLPPVVAVVWSGVWNFLGVLLSGGAVAYAIVTLLPVDLILNVGSASGYAMIFALLLAAVAWNLGTWWAGIPNSSSHALIGSILGVGLANQLLSGGSATAGVEWGQAYNVLLALFVSPLVGFGAAYALLWVMRRTIRDEALYREPKGQTPPPRGIRALLIFTCTAVSFAHGSNDGQKGMGLIMLILIGVAPTAYALNRTMSDAETPAFVAATGATQAVLRAHGAPAAPLDGEAARDVLKGALRTHSAENPQVFGALDAVSGDVAERIRHYGSVQKVPAAATRNLRNDMYLVSDTLHLVNADETHAETAFGEPGAKTLHDYEKLMSSGTRYIPTWVKIAVALALGLGTMVGWKRIVVTVGERIGKMHLTYGMGAAAELVAASTILLAQFKGMPVSTTHILSSGVAGASVANGSALQGRTVRNIMLAWVLTLPVAIVLAGGLYALLLGVVHALGMR